MNEEIQKFIDLLLRSRHAVVLSGAGISAPSGIPDFRSPGGIWDGIDPYSIFSSWSFQRNPEVFYREGLKLLAKFLHAKPNVAHRLLARLEEMEILKAAITQNIDGLHQRAGSKNVIELHGNLREGYCIRCNKWYSIEEILKKMEKEIPPLCDRCKGTIKPNLILFGDNLPQREYGLATLHASQCDLMLVMGSSLVVGPVDGLPAIALRNKAKLIILNLGATRYDSQAELILHKELDEVCREILRKLEEKEFLT